MFPLEWHDPKTGEVSSGYRESGYFPEAVVNFLALLGWNPGTEQELFSLEELVEVFDISKCSKSGAKFDYQKGIWFNHEYILRKSNELFRRSVRGRVGRCVRVAVVGLDLVVAGRAYTGIFIDVAGFGRVCKVVIVFSVGRAVDIISRCAGDCVPAEAGLAVHGRYRHRRRCEPGLDALCRAAGLVKIEMHFLADVYVPCEVCHGARYNRETLEVLYKGKNIAQVLDMTCEEAVDFFANLPKIRKKAQMLVEVGLGYIKLGQASTTLSGGEAQRVKLATELSRTATGRTIYILDEPTTGLHSADVHRLIEVLNRLVDGGNTVLVIEHNLDVIKTADYIIDLGPEGGDGGGTVIAAGTPEEVAKVADSYTGQYLRKGQNLRETIS